MDRLSQRLVTVASFGSPAEARLAHGRLEEAGVPSWIDGEATGTNLWYVGTALGGVRLQVSEADAERADQILSGVAGEAPEVTISWTCPDCGETVDAGYAVCWSCGRSVDGGTIAAGVGDAAQNRSESESPASVCNMCGGDVAAGVAQCPNCGEAADQRSGVKPPPAQEDEDTNPAEDSLRRAWNAAVFGIILLPPLLNLYSVTQLAEYHRIRVENDLPKSWKGTATFWIDAVVIFGALFLIFKIAF